ncbi:hypothetical protein M1D93_05560 [Arthrobacter sp. Z1-9]
MPDFKYVDVDRLHFDPDNPRFPKTVDGENIDSVLDFMLNDANLVDLMGSIAEQGFFPGEPLLVSPHGEGGDDWIVVEGNRRLAATLLLLRPEAAPTRSVSVRTVAASAKERPDQIPCLQFETRQEILEHLGYRHVTGIKEWDPLAKARYLKQLYDGLSGDPQNRYQHLARNIGSRKDYVGRLLTALAIYGVIEDSNFYNVDKLNEETLNFSLLSSVLAYERIVTFLGLPTAQSAELPGLDRGALQWLTRWIFERGSNGRTILGESRNIRVLADVVSHPGSKEALKAGQPLALAAKLSGAATESFNVAIAAARENVSLAHNYIDDLDEVLAADTAAVNELFTDVRALRQALQNRADGED